MADEWKLSVLQHALEELRAERDNLKHDFDRQYAHGCDGYKSGGLEKS